MSNRLPTPWLMPVTVDPKFFVNRSQKVAELLNLLSDHVLYGVSSALVNVRGDRGIGKSIFVRKVLQDLGALYPQRVIPVVVDHRGADERQILRDFIKKFVGAAPAVVNAANATELNERWIAPLGQLFYAGDRLVRGATDARARESGSSIDVTLGLWDVLQARSGFQWKDKTEQSQRVESSLEITAEVLRAALIAVLEALDGKFIVVVFFDDLDQAQQMENPERAKSTFRAVLDIGPCISILHLRSEVAGFADWRREVSATLALGGLNADELEAVVQGRVEKFPGPHLNVLAQTGAWDPLRALMRATHNPLVLLRWVTALAAMWPTWPPEGWNTPENLRRLAVAALNGPQPPLDLLERLGATLDRLGRETGLTEADLERGHLSVAQPPNERGLTKDQIAFLRRYELLVPVDAFDPAAGFRVDPLLRLVQPSVAKAVQQGP